MADLNNDIEKYLRGELTPAEMHSLEQKALNDPFLAEALEGAHHVGAEHFGSDLEALRQSLKQKTRRHEKRGIISIHGSWQWYVGIAAGLALLIVSTFTIITMMKDQKQNIAQAESSTNAPASTMADSVVREQKPDTLIAMNEPGEQASEESRVTRPRAERRNSQIRVDDQPTLAPVENEEVVPAEREVEVNLSEAPVIVNDEVTEDAGVSELADKPAATGATSRQKTAAINTTLIRGKIVDDTGSPLPGVNVVIKGTTKGTVSGADGDFMIDLERESAVLVFNFIGLQVKELSVSPTTPQLTVTMDADQTQLSEVVVTGAGIEAKDRTIVPTFEMAQPVGGRRAFNKYLEDNVRYPTEAVNKKVEGRVTVEFIVQPDGRLTDFKVVKGIGSGCDEELIRLIQQGPKWTPSMSDGSALQEKVRIRFKFDLP